MIPHIIFNSETKYSIDRKIWRSKISPPAPKNKSTSGITQPPMLAEAIVHIGKKLNKADRIKWYNQIFPKIVAYHGWIYRERDFKKCGLATLVHPWEYGLDNTPPWMDLFNHQTNPWFISLMSYLKIDKIVDHIRFDAKYVDIHQRTSSIEAIRLYDSLRRIRKKRYKSDLILNKPQFAIEDLTFNSILIRGNQLLEEIATQIGKDLPEELKQHILRSRTALEELWDDELRSYFSRDSISGMLLKEPSVATLLPLYSGSISKAKAMNLVQMIHNKKLFGLEYPLPSVPLTSKWFDPWSYWQGPSWVNIN